MTMNTVTTKRLTRSLSALVATILLSSGVALSLPARPAHAATPTQLTNLRFSWMGGLLTRTQVRFVTVSLTLVDPDGIVPEAVTWADAPLDCPCVLLEHDVPAEPLSRYARAVHLHLASGTTKNGVWAGSFALGAADGGFWRPTAMAAGDIVAHSPVLLPPDDEILSFTPAPWNGLTVKVQGYDWPRAWLGTPVASGARFIVRGGVALTSSKAPVAGMRLEIHGGCQFANQWSQSLTYRAVRTDAQGRYAYSVTPTQLSNSFRVCAAEVAYPTDTRDSFVVQSNIRQRG